jgi:phosphatidylserine/phosphatidylglycerophosphate/cardiolipin synthase-like enzyme
MHAKTMMADNIFSLVGSYNINPTSEGQSFEQVLACVDQDLADSFQSSIVTDALNSIPVPLLTP